jgi:hypothetical protein
MYGMDAMHRAARELGIGLLLLAWWASACDSRARTANPTLAGDAPPITPNLSGVTVASGTPIFQDDFNQPGSGWEVYDEAPASAAYVDGEYSLTLKRTPLRAWGVLQDVAVPSDVTITVTGRLGSGAADGAYGVMCRFSSDRQYYFFVVSGEGGYLIGKRSGESLIGLSATGMQRASTILTGAVPNLITAQCLGDTLSLSINAAPLASVQDGELTSGYVGLLAVAAQGDGLEALFDNVAIYKP